MRVIAWSFFALATYVTVEAVRALLGAGEAEQSTVGIVLVAISVVAMSFLSLAQRRPGANSARPAQSPTPNRPCSAPTYPPLSAAVLVGLSAGLVVGRPGVRARTCRARRPGGARGVAGRPVLRAHRQRRRRAHRADARTAAALSRSAARSGGWAAAGHTCSGTSCCTSSRTPPVDLVANRTDCLDALPGRVGQLPVPRPFPPRAEADLTLRDEEMAPRTPRLRRADAIVDPVIRFHTLWCSPGSSVHVDTRGGRTSCGRVATGGSTGPHLQA
jgi:hypothetical protein